MTKLEKAKIVHDEAMLLSQKADMARLVGDENQAKVLYKQSFSLESEAAMAYLNRFDKEPIRAILYRSAASLALECSMFKEAEQLIKQGLRGNTPLDIANELHDLSRQIPQNQTLVGA